MSLALKQALKAKEEGEIPVGAILVKDGLLIAQAYNQPIAKNDPTAHAEIQLLRLAGAKLKNYRLTGTSLYVTLEPCMMCLGAIIHARVERIIFGAHDSKIGVCESSKNLIDVSCSNHKIELTGGILENKSSEILKNFFISRR